MARLVIEVKDDTLSTIKKAAKKAGLTIEVPHYRSQVYGKE